MYSDHPPIFGGVPTNNGHSRTSTESSPNSDAKSDLEALRDFVVNGWLQYSGTEGPAFLWNRMIPQISIQDDHTRANSPVATLEQARSMMMTPIEWYLQAIGSTTASATPTAGGYDIPRVDMPTFRMETHALAGVNAVVGNALMSSRWVEGARNLALACHIASMFVGNIADRNDEGFNFLRNLIQSIRIYFDAIARNADPQSAEQALQMMTDVACSEDFRLNPMQMVELLSCCLSFAQWDDTRVLAYDALSRAEHAMEHGVPARGADADTDSDADDHEDDDLDDHYDDDYFDADDDNGDEAMFEDEDGTPLAIPEGQLRDRFRQSMLFLRHDLLRVSGEHDEADRFLQRHREMEPMADAYAARLISLNRWRELLEFSENIMAESANQQLTMIPADLVPYEWDSIREMALYALGRHHELQRLYRERIVEAYGREEIINVPRLRAISGNDWSHQVQQIVREYDDGRGRFTRNLAYEQMLINERLGIQAWRYCLQFPKARGKLAKTIALVNPDRAKSMVLGKINPNGTYQGPLPARTVVYKGMASTLERYAAIFGMAQASEIAQRIVTHYPTRRRLAVELQQFLDAE